MIGWRRRAKAARDETVSPERLYELVSQTLLENFGPLGSYAITRRSATDTDDIFHTALARSVAHDIVSNLAEHGVVLKPVVASAPAVRAVPPVVVAAPAVAARASAAPAAGRALVGRAAARSTTPAFPASAALAPVDAVTVPRDLARGIGALGARPAVASGPLDDDALRSLVAHHEQVEAAVAAKGGVTASGPTAPIAI